LEDQKMKQLLGMTAISLVVAFGSIAAVAQCDRTTQSPIRCGYYDEGYQDGASDANSSRRSDYRRYRSKFESQYESFYRDGYQSGYDSVRPGGGTTRWTGAQRNAYDAGYEQGQNDRRYGGGRRDAGESRYDASIGLYYQQGYDDGFSNRSRRYDFAIGGGTNYPPGTGSGASWSGRVDGQANIIIRGGSIRTEDASGTGLQIVYQTMNGNLPRRSTTVSATKTSGRGEVRVMQQPNRSNDYTAIVQVYDPRSGAGDYTLEISWGGSGGGGGAGGAQEPYRSGSVRWRGRVDQTATITISGNNVQSDDTAGTGLSNVTYDLNGYLARRTGTVSVQKRSGRGNVTILQQPSWENDFVAVIQVFDPGGGADNYEVEINW
jgi:hypothetical protein